MHRRLAACAGIALAALAVAGCADTQPGDQNPGVGYTNNVSDLLVKIPALTSDPCRGAQAPQLFPSCGRFVTEVSNTVNALHADVPGQATEINALSTAIHAYQSLSCDSAGNTPTATQNAQCPAALTAIGRDLDQLAHALASVPTNR
jgi:hypothetical protein